MTQPRTVMLLDELENNISMGKRVPLSTMVMIDRDRCRQLVQDVRAELPADMTAAESIIQNQSSIIAEARDIAEQTKNDANMRANRAVNEANAQAQNTVNMANQKAQEMMMKAQEQSQKMLADAKDKAMQMITDAEAHAKQLVSEQEIVTRARMEVEVSRREVDRLNREIQNLRAKLAETGKK